MKFKRRQPASWNICALDPSTLSDEQAEFFYAKAIHEGADVDEQPPGSMGRLTIAAQYVSYCQRQLRKLTEVPKPEF